MRARKNRVKRAVRGGSYFDYRWSLRGTGRFGNSPVYRGRFSGFRFVLRGQK